MSRTINFVAARRKKLSFQQQGDRKYFAWSLRAFIGLFVVFLLVLGVRFYFVFQVKALADEQKSTRQLILSQEGIERDYNIFANKLHSLTELFGKRKDKQEAFVFFSNVFGPDVIVSGIDYSASEEDILSFTIQAPNVFVFDNVFETLETEAVRDTYPKVARSNVRRTASGFYSMTLTVTVGK